MEQDKQQVIKQNICKNKNRTINQVRLNLIIVFFFFSTLATHDKQTQLHKNWYKGHALLYLNFHLSFGVCQCKCFMNPKIKKAQMHLEQQKKHMHEFTIGVNTLK